MRNGVGEHNRVQVVSSQGVVPLETYVEVVGKVTPLPLGKVSFQPVEIQCEKITVIGKSTSDVASICPDSASVDVKVDQRHIYLRNDQFSAVTKLRAVLVSAMRKTFEGMNCTEIFPPSFVANQCEGGSTLFKLKYPPAHGEDIDAYLTQSSQFYLEMTVPALGNTYCIAPSFRAERSHTRRHLTEFLHAECEWKDIYTFDGHLAKLKQLFGGIISNFLRLDRDGLLNQYNNGKQTWRERVESLAEMKITAMTHAEAIAYCRDNCIYKDENTQTHFDPRDDIPEAQEREMIDRIGCIVLLCKFPREFKSFYMATDPEDPSLALGCDVEVPGVGEVIGSGVRVWDQRELRERLAEQGLKEDEYREYIDLRKYGFARTSGMGLGVDRFLTWLLGMYSIRDVVTFPRFPGKLAP